MGKRGPKPLWQGKQEAVNAWFKPGTLAGIERVLKKWKLERFLFEPP
jgi:hypothetical protein